MVGLAPGGGDVATVGPAGGLGDGEDLALGRGEQAAGAAGVEDHAGAVEHDGDDPGGARQAACLPGGDGLVGDGGHPEVGQQLVELHGDQDGGRISSVQGKTLRVDGLEERHERGTQPLVVGPPVLARSLRVLTVCGTVCGTVPGTVGTVGAAGAGGLGAAGVGEGLEVGGEPVGDGVGAAEDELADPATEPAAAQECGPGGAGLLGGQQSSLELLGDLGGDHVEDPAAQGPQPPGPEPGGLVDQPMLRGGPGGRADPIGQRVDGVEDDLGLGQADRPVPQGVGGRLVLDQRPAQAQPTPALGTVTAAVVGQPRRRIARARLRGDVVGDRQDPHPQLLEPVDPRAETQQRRRLLLGAQEHRVDPRDLGQRRLDRRHRSQHRMQHREWLSRHGRTCDRRTPTGLPPHGTSIDVDASASPDEHRPPRARPEDYCIYVY